MAHGPWRHVLASPATGRVVLKDGSSGYTMNGWLLTCCHERQHAGLSPEMFIYEVQPVRRQKRSYVKLIIGTPAAKTDRSIITEEVYLQSCFD